MNELPELPTYLFEPSLAGLISTVLTFILPLIAGLLMRANWSAGAKGTTLLAVAAVKVFLENVAANLADGVAFNPWVLLYGVVLNFLVAVAVHFGLLRGTSIQRAAMASGNTGPGGAHREPEPLV
jgi:hypothetical protein